MSLRVASFLFSAFTFVASARADGGGPFAQLGAGMFVPPEGGKLGAAMHLDLAYAKQLGPLSLAPGGRFSAYVGPDHALAGLATLRCSYTGPVAVPYLFVGAGAGQLGALRGAALALEAGAGLLFPVASHLAVGAEAGYQDLGHRIFESVYLEAALRVAL
jgi:hypothetical protein